MKPVVVNLYEAAVEFIRLSDVMRILGQTDTPVPLSMLMEHTHCRKRLDAAFEWAVLMEDMAREAETGYDVTKLRARPTLYVRP
jgi:hypothetical protein